VKDESREVAGFLCRWCLLALASVLAASAAFVGAVAASPRQEALRLTLSDVACPASPFAAVPGRLVPSPEAPADLRLLALYGDRMRVCSYEVPYLLYLPLDPASAGDLSVRVIGVPYVFLMFGGQEGTIRLVSPGARAFLIDSSLDEAERANSPGPWARAVELMGRRGTLAFFHPGPAESLEAFRADLRHRGMAAPVLCEFADKAPALASLRLAFGSLRQQGRGPCLMTVVTDDPERASAGAALGCRAHWVMPPGAAPAANDRRVTVHRDLASFVQFLEIGAAGE
jgi:hypothetical protein